MMFPLALALQESGQVKMENNSKYSLYLDSYPEELTIDVPANSTYQLNLACFEKIPPKSNITINVHEGATFLGAMADFTSESCLFNIVVNLLGEGSVANWHLASLSFKNAKKVYETSVNHLARHTEALMSNYGIARNSSKITFTGTSEIVNGAEKAKTRQEAKIIVFDPEADGLASPFLKISDNDVVASHAAIVGKLNEEHLFYLESRGLSEEEAKRLIALGYLKPIEEYFTDEEVIKRIDSIIEGEI